MLLAAYLLFPIFFISSNYLFTAPAVVLVGPTSCHQAITKKPIIMIVRSIVLAAFVATAHGERKLSKAAKASGGKGKGKSKGSEGRGLPVPEWFTISRGFPNGNTTLFKEGNLEVKLRCVPDDELLVDILVTNPGHTVLSCYVQGENFSPSNAFEFDVQPGESELLEGVWDSDGLVGNNEDEVPLVCSNGIYFGIDSERTIGTLNPGVGFGNDVDCHFSGLFFVSESE